MIAFVLFFLMLSFTHIQHCQIEDNDHCIKCQPHFYLLNNLCETCPIYCMSCKIENQQIKCDTCSDPMHMTEICTCTDIRKYVGKSGMCIECPISCHQCTGDDVGSAMCGTCSDRLNMVNKYDHCECKNSEQFVNRLGLCTSCSPICKKCHGTEGGMEWCDDCINMGTMKIVNGECVCKLESDYIGNDFNCHACDLRCESCHGGSNKECISCSDKMPYIIFENDICDCDIKHSYKDGKCNLVYSWQLILILLVLGLLVTGILLISVYINWC